MHSGSGNHGKVLPVLMVLDVRVYCIAKYYEGNKQSGKQR